VFETGWAESGQLSLQVDDPAPRGVRDRIGSPGHVQLVDQAADMEFGCVGRDAEPPPNLLVGNPSARSAITSRSRGVSGCSNPPSEMSGTLRTRWPGSSGFAIRSPGTCSNSAARRAAAAGRAKLGGFHPHTLAGGLLVWLGATWAHIPLAGWSAGIWRWIS
jgi:hypothetical protein